MIDEAKVDEPPGGGVDRAAQGEFDLVGVAVQAGAGMLGGKVTELVGGFEVILFDEANGHYSKMRKSLYKS